MRGLVTRLGDFIEAGWPKQDREWRESSKIRLEGDEMSGIILKDDDEVRSLTKIMCGSYQKLMFEFWYDYPNQVVIATRGLSRWGATLGEMSPLVTSTRVLDTLSSIKKSIVRATWEFEWIINEFLKYLGKHKYSKETTSPHPPPPPRLPSKFTNQLGSFTI